MQYFMLTFVILSRIAGCPSPWVRCCNVIEGIQDNIISFLFLLTCLLGYVAVILFFPWGVPYIPSLSAFLSYLFVVTTWTLQNVR
jgi:hypothetical protein